MSEVYKYQKSKKFKLGLTWSNHVVGILLGEEQGCKEYMKHNPHKEAPLVIP